jgi:TrmH family RNA methyltransferase
VEREVIRSRTNRRVAEVRRLRLRKEREASGLFFAEGIRVVAEAVELGAGIETLVVARGLLTSEFGAGLIEEQVEKGVPCLELSAEVFRSLSLKDNPQGLGAVVRQRWGKLDEIALREDSRWVVLDGVQDPGNLGTILRTSDASGSDGVILVGKTTDPYDPTSVRASTGAVFSQGLVRASFDELADWKRRRGVTLVGTSGAAPVDYRAVTYETPAVILMGSEREGLSEDQQAACDLLVKIPMVGRSDSLNLAVATGLVLYEVFVQCRQARVG